VRRTLINILCILSLLLGAAAITRCATIPRNNSRTAEIVIFGTLWTISCNDKLVWANIERPPFASRTFPRNTTIEPEFWDFVIVQITYLDRFQATELSIRIDWGAAILIPLILPAAVAIYRYRHRPKLVGHCKKCRYNLTGNTSGICPECGTKISN